ncbi:MAG: threonine synthase [Lysobacterales bacterium]|jgi:threonine synthase
MPFINIKHPEQRVLFREAVETGIGRDQGLFMPETLVPIVNIPALLEMGFVERSILILEHIIGTDLDRQVLESIVTSAFNFPVPLKQVSKNCHALELYHGTSLAFKDFGARFMSFCLAALRMSGQTNKPMTILTATSGDTGAAVAQAFFGQPGINVVVLYPKGRITPLQEKLFCTLGGNIRTFAVEDDFDACQAMVKRSFTDPELVSALGLNSANSINIARLLAQVCYYFEAVARLPAGTRPVFSVPSGNFGNVTAGLIACAIGLPVNRMIAATNNNDTVPRYLQSGHWDPQPTVATISNAMDVSQPSNFQRVLALGASYGVNLEALLVSRALTDDETREAMRALYDLGYLADPHSALGWQVLQDQLGADENGEDETGVFLCTAHPAKFRDEVESVLNIKLDLPEELREVENRQLLSVNISNDFSEFKQLLLQAGN